MPHVLIRITTRGKTELSSSHDLHFTLHKFADMTTLLGVTLIDASNYREGRTVFLTDDKEGYEKAERIFYYSLNWVIANGDAEQWENDANVMLCRIKSNSIGKEILMTCEDWVKETKQGKAFWSKKKDIPEGDVQKKDLGLENITDDHTRPWLSV